MKPRGIVRRDPNAAQNTAILADAPRLTALALSRGWMFPTPPEVTRARLKAMGAKPKSKRPKADKNRALGMIAGGATVADAAAAIGAHVETVRNWTEGRHMRTTHGRAE